MDYWEVLITVYTGCIFGLLGRVDYCMHPVHMLIAWQCLFLYVPDVYVDYWEMLIPGKEQTGHARLHSVVFVCLKFQLIHVTYRSSWLFKRCIHKIID